MRTIDPEKTTDEFIDVLFDKRDIQSAAVAYDTGYRLAKAFMSIKPKVVPDVGTLLQNARVMFHKGYREALDE